MRIPSPSRGYILLFALAYGGAFITFMPFVTVLLPIKAEAAAPADSVRLLSAAALGGAAVASVANIMFGMLSDRTRRLRGTRRPWIAGGLALLVVAYAAFAAARSPWAVLAAVALLQLAINMAFAPLIAVMADEVPDRSKGLVAGLMGVAQPMGSLSSVLVLMPGLGSEATRYLLLCGLFLGMMLPFVLFTRETGAGGVAAPDRGEHRRRRVDFLRAWAARAMVQIAGNGISTYGFFYFQGQMGATTHVKVGGETAAIITDIMAIATLLAMAAALFFGRASDRAMRRKPFLAIAAAALAGGLVLMALSAAWWIGATGYILAMAGMAAFLALHSALTMQILPSPDHRGRDLGILNLTNTLPAMIAPLLALALAPDRLGFAPLFLLLAGGTLLGGAIMLGIRHDRPEAPRG